LRVAYLIVPRGAVERFQEADLNADRPPPAPSQIILADFLTSGQLAKHLRRCRDAYAQRREALVTALREECPGLIAIDPGQEGLFICARLPRGVDDLAIAAKARERGIILAPLSSRYDRPTEDRGLLFGFAGYEPDRLREGVKTLAPILKAMVPARSLAAVG
jgi:GntR family transcriptional regulator/MocR family aminotransferase